MSGLDNKGRKKTLLKIPFEFVVCIFIHIIYSWNSSGTKPNVKPLKVSKTDWEVVEKMDDKDIDLSEVPEVTAEQMSQARLRVGGKPISGGKVRVNMYLDAEIVAYFKAQAGGRGYQTLINQTLRESIRQQNLEEILRRVIREELEELSVAE
jgi:uncharacterized protein (DUF4415 family)